MLSVPAAELPDYYPPIRDPNLRADVNGNLWILPSTSTGAQGGGLLYDVVNRNGDVFERVQLPSGCALAALAPRDVVYLVCGNVRLEKRRIVREGRAQ
jgi:hypothetical protein